MPSDIRKALEFWGFLCLWNTAATISCQFGDLGEMIGSLMFGIEMFLLPFILLWRFISSRIDLVRQRSFMLVLEYLDQAIRLNMPLPVMLKAAGVGERGWVGRTLRNIGKDIENGESIENAIRLQHEFAPLRVTAAIGIAERTGAFNTMLPWLIKTEKQRLTMQDARRGISNGYLNLLLLVTMALLLFVSVLIVPKFERIFEDFAVQSSSMLFYTVYVGKWLWGNASSTQSVPGVMWIFLLLIAFILLRLPTSRQWVRRVMYRVPLLGRVFETRHLADVCFVIGQGLSTGIPVNDAIMQARSLEITPSLQHKLTQWGTRLEEGVTFSQSARQAGLPAIMVNLLAGVENTSDTVSTFDFLSSYYASKFSRIWVMFRSITGPLVVLGIGCVVGIAAYSLFEPLIILIWHNIRNSGTY